MSGVAKVMVTTITSMNAVPATDKMLSPLLPSHLILYITLGSGGKSSFNPFNRCGNRQGKDSEINFSICFWYHSFIGIYVYLTYHIT